MPETESTVGRSGSDCVFLSSVTATHTYHEQLGVVHMTVRNLYSTTHMYLLLLFLSVSMFQVLIPYIVRNG